MNHWPYHKISILLVLVAVVFMFTTPALAGKKDDTLYFSWKKELTSTATTPPGRRSTPHLPWPTAQLSIP